MLSYLLKWGTFSAVVSIITVFTVAGMLDLVFDRRQIIVMIVAVVASCIAALGNAFVLYGFGPNFRQGTQFDQG